MKKSFNTLRIRFYSFFVLFVLALFSVVAITSFQQQQSVVSIAVSIAGMPILDRAASFIDGDKYELFVESLDPDDPFFVETQALFHELRADMQVQFLYSMAIDRYGNHIFIFDGEDPDSDHFSHLGDIEDIDDYDNSFLLTYETGSPQYTEVMYDYTEWGRLVSAYAPIFNSNGDVVGIVGVDFSGDEIHSAILTSLRQLIILAGILAAVGIFLFFFLMKDLTGQNKDIKLRDSLLSTVNNATTMLLQAERDEFEGALWESMGMMARTVKVDRVYIWKNHTVGDKLYCTQLYEWSEGAKPQQNNEYTVDIPYDENIPGWKEKFMRRECVNNIVKDMSLEEQAQLSPQGIISILTVPVFLREEFWGFVGFDDCRNERIFTSNEESILRSGSLLIAYALLRHDMTQRLETALNESNAASVAKGNFLSNMSHEMRTPMNAIIGMTAIGKKADDIEEKNLALNKIGEASTHLLGIINDILDMSKIEADKMELVPVEYNLNQMIKKVLTVISLRIDEKHQLLTVNVADNIPKYVIGDDQRLSQVITNLLSNAVKFTPEEGKINIDVSLYNETDESIELQFSVSDTGIGISAEKQEKLFSAFEQGDEATHRVYGGTGLGLSISKRIVEMMNGKIWVESEINKGAKFIFIVELERSNHKANFSGDSSEVDIENPANISHVDEFKDKYLLIAEDVAINREILISLLKETGLIIECAVNGREALEMISNNPGKYDIVFMDLQMPEMDGLEASRLIRLLPFEGIDKLPIVAMTANVFKDDIDACFEAGMNDHLGKPLDIDKVFNKLCKYLNSIE